MHHDGTCAEYKLGEESTLHVVLRLRNINTWANYDSECGSFEPGVLDKVLAGTPRSNSAQSMRPLLVLGVLD